MEWADYYGMGLLLWNGPTTMGWADCYVLVIEKVVVLYGDWLLTST
jgi:hypothetical protein